MILQLKIQRTLQFDTVTCFIKNEPGNLIQMLRTAFRNFSLPFHVTPLSDKTIDRTKFEVLQCSTCSPDFKPSEFHAFGPLKETLRDTKFSGDDTRSVMDQQWPEVRKEIFYSVKNMNTLTNAFISAYLTTHDMAVYCDYFIST